jgi:exopolysaccharide biosynthesis predicted pyruvyltransferase EpsI
LTWNSAISHFTSTVADKDSIDEIGDMNNVEDTEQLITHLESFLKRRELYGAMICSFLLGLRPVHLLTQLHGNIGDHLIWAGTKDLLKSGGVGFSEISVSDMVSGRCAGETLVIPGSGALTTRWHEWLPALILEASEIFNRVVILPSSYDPSVTIVAKALSQPNVYAFAREPRSYREIKANGRAALALDPALFFLGFHDFSSGGAPIVESTNRLICLREDLSSPLPERGFKPNPLCNNDISLTSVGLDEFLQKIRAADLVITDRLHVAVAAVMSGKRIQYLDPYDGKISIYFSFAFRETFEHLAVPCTIEWLHKRDFIIPKGSE